MGGLLSTDGGLVFGGDDSNMVALDASHGTESWHFNTGVGIAAAPATYLVDKKLADYPGRRDERAHVFAG